MRDKSGIYSMFTSTRLKKIHNCHIIKILILHKLAQFKLYMRVETLVFNKLLIFSRLLLEMSPFGPHAQARRRRRHSPIALSTTPCSMLNQTSNKRCLIKFSDVANSRLMHGRAAGSTTLQIHRVEVRAIWWSYIGQMEQMLEIVGDVTRLSLKFRTSLSSL
jgi:hypothetical protein